MDEAEVKVIIKSLLGSSQVQMTQNDLHKLFREFAGMAIPYKQYGFSNCQDYLKSIPDTCIVSGVGPYAQVTAVLSSNSAHIVDMISKQKPIKQPRQQRPRSRPIIVQGRPFHAPQYPVPPRFHVQQRQSVAVCNVKPQYRNFHNQPSSSYNFKQNHTSPPANSSNNFKQKHTSPPAKSSYNFKQKRTSSRVNNTSDDVWDEISPSVNGHGYVVNTIHKELCEGVLHQENITKHVPEVPCKEELRDIEERNESIPESSASSFDHSLNYKVPYEIQENLKQLIHNFPDGLWLYNLLEEYKKLFGSELDYRKYNYVSLVQMCLSLNYIFIYKHLRKDGGKLYIANRPVPDDACGELLKLAEEAAEEKEVYVPCANAVPDVICYADNVMLPGDTIPAETMDLNNLYTPVMIAEVYDLSKFWFILADNDKKLEDLETDMETFYNVKYKYYEIPERLLQKGLFVIAYRAPRDYYRAVVVKILPYSVKVFCVDSGMVLETTRSTIYFMHKEFSQLSRQGLRGRLSGLMPPTKQEQWSRDAAFRFLQLVKESTLFGSVASTDDSQSDLIYELVLCDSSYAEDVFIHDILMAENYAVATEQVTKTQFTDSSNNSTSASHSFSDQPKQSAKTCLELMQILRRIQLN